MEAYSPDLVVENPSRQQAHLARNQSDFWAAAEAGSKGCHARASFSTMQQSQWPKEATD